jgi:hypothetical protein
MADNIPEVADATSNPTEAFNAEITTSTNPANDDIAKRIQDARAQEKSKLYPQMEKLQEELSTLRKRDEERNALEAEREAERAAKRAEREAAKKAQLEEEMSVKELLKAKETEWQKQLEAERQERERAFALLDREREFNELAAYRSQRIEQERDNIIPSLIDLVSGNSRDEIEQSILTFKSKSAEILEESAAAFNNATQNSRKDMVGSRVTMPAAGPLDTNSDPLSFSPDAIKNMSAKEYAEKRSKILGAAANNRGQGLFGN